MKAAKTSWQKGSCTYSADKSGHPRIKINWSGDFFVSSGRIEESKREVAVSLSVFPRETLEQFPVRKLGELLSVCGPGHIQKYPGALTSISIRGFRTDTHGNDLQGNVAEGSQDKPADKAFPASNFFRYEV